MQEDTVYMIGFKETEYISISGKKVKFIAFRCHTFEWNWHQMLKSNVISDVLIIQTLLH